MKQSAGKPISRRQAVVSIAAASAGTLIEPTSIFCAPSKDKLRVAVIGDWGTGEEDQFSIARQMFASHRREPFDFVITAGDNIYPDGNGRHFIKKFERPFADLIKDRINFYATLGNHDVYSGREDQRQYNLFNMGGQRYYRLSKGEGLAEFFMLDSTDFDSSQSVWLEDSLRASCAKWKIAVFHHPIYSSGKKHGPSVGLRKRLEPLFIRYGVNAAFSGHDHIYERAKPQQGVYYFVTGAGGKLRRGNVDMKSSTREASYDQDNHFMLIEIDDKQMAFQSISETGSVVDSGSILAVISR
ncbi:MAG: metallophosphoesterase [Acidobacteriota bacterium]